VIAKISPGKGSSPVGLMAYLFGPGRGNEHSDMRVIAADGALGVLDGQRLDARRDRAEVVALGQRLDFARRAFGTEVPGGHVWHMSLALPAGEHLADEQWAQVAREAMDVLGFSGADGKAPCRWVAVAHGESSNENEHIHIAVTLVRGDGTRASIWNDRRKMSKFAAEVERRFGLFVVEGRAGAGKPSLSRAELERATKTQTEPERTRLARMVRAHAQASADEAEFARRLRDDDQLLARPRFAAGGRDVVTGYSVALAVEAGAAPLWFGGGRTGPDLSLPRLRAGWPDTEDRRAEAAQAWAGIVTPGRESQAFVVEAWPAATEEVRKTTARLKELDPNDTATWAAVTREAAGVFAALSTSLEPGGGPLAGVADALAELSWRRHDQAKASRAAVASSLRGVAMVCRQASRTGADDAILGLIVAMFILVRALDRARVLTARAEEAQRRLETVRQAMDPERFPPALGARLAAEVAASRSPQDRRAAAARATSPAAGRSAPGRSATPAPRPPQPPQRRGGPDLGR
jgi:relaxase-like protein